MTDSVSIYNPWREFIENCISGDNYFRASEYRDLLEELDAHYVEISKLSADSKRLDFLLAHVNLLEAYTGGKLRMLCDRADIDEAIAALKATGATA
jgi:hypothetical protein